MYVTEPLAIFNHENPVRLEVNRFSDYSAAVT